MKRPQGLPQEALLVGELPQDLIEALYPSMAFDWITIWWNKKSNLPAVDDGGAWWKEETDQAYLQVLDLLGSKIDQALKSFHTDRTALGSSQHEASHHLLFDILGRGVFICPSKIATDFVGDKCLESLQRGEPA